MQNINSTEKTNETNKFYALSLHGGGDSQYTIVDEKTWKWIFSDWNVQGNAYGGIDLNCPVDIKERIAENYDEDPKTFNFHVTSGSFQNDRALGAPGAVINGETTQTCFSTGEFLDLVKKLGIKFEDEWEGHIY